MLQISLPHKACQVVLFSHSAHVLRETQLHHYLSHFWIDHYCFHHPGTPSQLHCGLSNTVMLWLEYFGTLFTDKCILCTLTCVLC